jgi:hypothetical protein
MHCSGSQSANFFSAQALVGFITRVVLEKEVIIKDDRFGIAPKTVNVKNDRDYDSNSFISKKYIILCNFENSEFPESSFFVLNSRILTFSPESPEFEALSPIFCVFFFIKNTDFNRLFSNKMRINLI